MNSHDTPLELAQSLLDKNEEWWRNESECRDEARELGMPNDADAPEVSMGDLRKLVKTLQTVSESGDLPMFETSEATPCGTCQLCGCKIYLGLAHSCITAPLPKPQQPQSAIEPMLPTPEYMEKASKYFARVIAPADAIAREAWTMVMDAIDRTANSKEKP